MEVDLEGGGRLADAARLRRMSIMVAAEVHVSSQVAREQGLR